ncbi:MAG TPA: hypothetical protein VN428_15365 [Bryobacteraceae bacterium]|nr:hypothetical protein [Bryobacteraceae bacterium]
MRVAAAPGACVASLPLGSFEVTVRPPMSDQPHALREVNVIERGYVIAYRPLEVPAEMQKEGRVALILVPASAQDKLTVLEPHTAAVPAQWTAPYRVGAVGLVLGPQGLDHDRVQSMLNKDRELMTQLAAYAEQTAQVETLITTLAAAENDSSASVDAALAGFANRYGTSVSKLDRSASTDKQAQALLSALMPSINSYDPLAPQRSARMQQSAGLAASVASLFFGSNVALAAGGAAMAQNLRSLMFPGTDFRSALAQPSTNKSVALCGSRQAPHRSRTRVAFLWGHKVPDIGAPTAALRSPVHALRGSAVLAPITGDWRPLDRAGDWALVREATRVPVPVRATAQGLEIDLVQTAAAPGTYQLAARWDWQTVSVPGEVHVHATPDLTKAVPTAAVEGSGPVLVTLTGADFGFVKELRLGQQVLPFTVTDTLRFTVDTNAVRAGRYKLALKQADASIQEVPFRVLPVHPAFTGLPLRANLGETEQTLTLRGSGLDRIEKIEAVGVSVELGPGGAAERKATVRLAPEAKQGDRIAASMKVEGFPEPVPVPNAIEVAGPRPRISTVNLSLPDDLGVALREGELPAGSYASFSMRVEHAGTRPAVELDCEDREKRVLLRAGEKRGAAKLETAGADLVFLSVDAGAAGRPGCSLSASVEAEAGSSDPRVLGRVVRLPRIESFDLTDEKAGEGRYFATLTGQDLELVERTGWDQKQGLTVDGLPKPIAGAGQKQSLRVVMPWPSPAPRSPLYVWLRGESEGRVTKARY